MLNRIAEGLSNPIVYAVLGHPGVSHIVRLLGMRISAVSGASLPPHQRQDINTLNGAEEQTFP